jgi:hypothetical protein
MIPLELLSQSPRREPRGDRTAVEDLHVETGTNTRIIVKVTRASRTRQLLEQRGGIRGPPRSCSRRPWRPPPVIVLDSANLKGLESWSGSRLASLAFGPAAGAWAGLEPLWTPTRSLAPRISVREAAKALATTPSLVQRHREYRNPSSHAGAFAS